MLKINPTEVLYQAGALPWATAYNLQVTHIQPLLGTF